ncbi:MAG: nucleoside transporter, partial [Verrucomicrobiales bacterium]|nr:nucleoside transporter [Verrucomicrobiales bacterium]
MKTDKQKFIKHSALACSAVAAAISANGSADYGPAIWRPTCSTHYYTGYTARQVYVIHDMEGYYASTISYLQGCNNSVSVHYCANGKQDTTSDMPAGEITQMVLDANSAWTAGCWNRYAEQTEHEGFVSNPAWYTEAMYQSSSALTLS